MRQGSPEEQAGADERIRHVHILDIACIIDLVIGTCNGIEASELYHWYGSGDLNRMACP
uniref:Uncharacterized protein n=1 Tax=Arundo donax TaxID=35708 RepID=A0A0A9GLH5_ARUDO